MTFPCRYCPAQIRWAQFKGHSLPFETTPVRGGLRYLLDKGQATRIEASSDQPGHRIHWPQCDLDMTRPGREDPPCPNDLQLSPS